MCVSRIEQAWSPPCPHPQTCLPQGYSVTCPRSHKQEADDITRVATTANDTSAEAFALLLRTLAGENQTALEIQELNRK